MSRRILAPLLAIAVLAGCAQVTQFRGQRNSASCQGWFGWFADWDDCVEAADSYCNRRGYSVIADHRKDEHPRNVLDFRCTYPAMK
ncbi:MAG: hypothetical protein ACM31L_04570 [Actinomycetota bacterium]